MPDESGPCHLPPHPRASAVAEGATCLAQMLGHHRPVRLLGARASPALAYPPLSGVEDHPWEFQASLLLPGAATEDKEPHLLMQGSKCRVAWATGTLFPEEHPVQRPREGIFLQLKCIFRRRERTACWQTPGVHLWTNLKSTSSAGCPTDTADWPGHSGSLRNLESDLSM